MVRSTSCSTCTAPKLLLIPRSCSSGSAMGPPPARSGPAVPRCRLAPGLPPAGCSISDRSGDAGLGAQVGVLAGADLGLLHRAVLDRRLDVVLGDRHGVEQHRGDVALAGLVAGRAGGLALLAVGEGQRQL